MRFVSETGIIVDNDIVFKVLGSQSQAISYANLSLVDLAGCERLEDLEN